MILILYREDVAAAAAALPADSPAALHFRYILSVMEKKELIAVSVEEHG